MHQNHFPVIQTSLNAKLVCANLFLSYGRGEGGGRSGRERYGRPSYVKHMNYKSKRIYL